MAEFLLVVSVTGEAANTSWNIGNADSEDIIFYPESG